MSEPRSKIPEYRTWLEMMRRCYCKPSREAHRNYVGRGISVAPRWQSNFDAFLNDVGRRPSREHSLDRIDNARGYEPGNVRWATRIEQANNRRTNRLVTMSGRTLTISSWVRELDLNKNTVWSRLEKGWSPEEALARSPLKDLADYVASLAGGPHAEVASHVAALLAKMKTADGKTRRAR